MTVGSAIFTSPSAIKSVTASFVIAYKLAVRTQAVLSSSRIIRIEMTHIGPPTMPAAASFLQLLYQRRPSTQFLQPIIHSDHGSRQLPTMYPYDSSKLAVEQGEAPPLRYESFR